MKTLRILALCALAAALIGCGRDNPADPAATGNLKAVDGLGDKVWLDTDGNGVQDAGEVGVAGVLVTLQDCAGEPAATDTTDADGGYLFTTFDAGDYQVLFTLPDGYAFTLQHAGADSTLDSDADPATGLTACLALADSLTELGVDAGLVLLPQVGTLGDRVWHDADHDGIQDEGEPGLQGVLVTLTGCDGAVVLTDTTDADGMYLFADVTAGDYVVNVTLPDSTWAFSPAGADSDGAVDSDVDPATGATACVGLAADEVNLDLDAGLYMPFVGDGCAHGKGYWKTHAELAEPMLPLLLGAEGGAMSRTVDSPAVVYAVLQQHTWGDPSNGITKLYAKLLTAKLNIANGADGSRAEAAVALADAFLADHDETAWDMLDREDKRTVQRLLGSFKVTSVGDDCGDDHDHDGDCGGDDDDDDDDGYGGDDDGDHDDD